MLRQFSDRIADGKTSLPGMVGKRPKLRRIDRHAVTETLEVLADGDEMNLGAARGQKVSICEHELHCGLSHALGLGGRGNHAVHHAAPIGLELQAQLPEGAVVDFEVANVPRTRRPMAGLGPARGPMSNELRKL
jgi:hypothetical protein